MNAFAHMASVLTKETMPKPPESNLTRLELARQRRDEMRDDIRSQAEDYLLADLQKSGESISLADLSERCGHGRKFTLARLEALQDAGLVTLKRAKHPSAGIYTWFATAKAMK